MSHRKKYAIVGVGGRSRMYYWALTTRYAETAELVGLCDLNQTRMNYANKVITQEIGADPIPTYGVDQFDDMIIDRFDCLGFLPQNRFRIVHNTTHKALIHSPILL